MEKALEMKDAFGQDTAVAVSSIRNRACWTSNNVAANPNQMHVACGAA